MRVFPIALALLLFSSACAAEPAKLAQKVVCHIRGLEGDPSGSIEKGTIKVLWEPHVVAVVGEEASFGSGGDNKVPGTTETLYGGVWVTIKSTKVVDGKISARISLEMSRLDDTDGETFVTSSGKFVRAVGTFEAGKPIKIIGQEKINGKQFWIEVTFEEWETAAPIVNAKRPINRAFLQREDSQPKR